MAAALEVADARPALQAFLDSAGHWGTQTPERWDAFLDWLADAGLLTTAMPSRTPGGSKASLDQLRAGAAGDSIPRGSVQAASLFSTQYL